jgi:DegV family protein with EDD domain
MENKKPIVIVTDSSCYLTKTEAESLGVQVMPMTFSYSGHTFSENYSDMNGNFAKIIWGGNNCTTSQPPISAYLSVFNEFTRKGYQILCITISARLSGSYSSAIIAAKKVSQDDIIVVDSLTTGGGLAFLIEKASELISTNLQLGEIAELIEKDRGNIEIAFSLGNIDALRKSGRISLIKQSVSAVLNIKPILLCKDGVITFHSNARGNVEQVLSLVNLVKENTVEIILHYIEKTSQYERLQNEIEKRFPSASIRENRLGPVLGIHLGRDVIGLAWR